MASISDSPPPSPCLLSVNMSASKLAKKNEESTVFFSVKDDEPSKFVNEFTSPNSGCHLRMFSEITNLDETTTAFDQGLISEDKSKDVSLILSDLPLSIPPISERESKIPIPKGRQNSVQKGVARVPRGLRLSEKPYSPFSGPEKARKNSKEPQANMKFFQPPRNERVKYTQSARHSPLKIAKQTPVIKRNNQQSKLQTTQSTYSKVNSARTTRPTSRQAQRSQRSDGFNSTRDSKEGSLNGTNLQIFNTTSNDQTKINTSRISTQNRPSFLATACRPYNTNLTLNQSRDVSSEIREKPTTSQHQRKLENSKNEFKERIYFRKQYPRDLMDDQLNSVLRDLIKSDVLNEVYQHKMSKIQSQRLFNRVIAQEVKQSVHEVTSDILIVDFIDKIEYDIATSLCKQVIKEKALYQTEVAAHSLVSNVVEIECMKIVQDYNPKSMVQSFVDSSIEEVRGINFSEYKDLSPKKDQQIQKGHDNLTNINVQTGNDDPFKTVMGSMISDLVSKLLVQEKQIEQIGDHLLEMLVDQITMNVIEESLSDAVDEVDSSGLQELHNEYIKSASNEMTQSPISEIACISAQPIKIFNERPESCDLVLSEADDNTDSSESINIQIRVPSHDSPIKVEYNNRLDSIKEEIDSDDQTPKGETSKSKANFIKIRILGALDNNQKEICSELLDAQIMEVIEESVHEVLPRLIRDKQFSALDTIPDENVKESEEVSIDNHTPHQSASPFNVSYFTDANISSMSAAHINELEFTAKFMMGEATYKGGRIFQLDNQIGMLNVSNDTLSTITDCCIEDDMAIGEHINDTDMCMEKRGINDVKTFSFLNRKCNVFKQSML